MRVGIPPVVIDSAIGDHLEVLGVVSRGRSSVRLVERVDHAYTLDRLLLDAVDELWRPDTDGFENRRHDVDNVVELVANPARVVNVAGPRNLFTLSGAT